MRFKHLPEWTWPISFYVLCFIVFQSVCVAAFNAWEGIEQPWWPWLNYSLFWQAYTQGGAEWQHYQGCFWVTQGIFLLGIGFEVSNRLSQKKARAIFGNAHFASRCEKEKAGLYATSGIVLGRDHSGRILRLPGFESLLLVAPTGSGKTWSVALPNLMEWNGSGVFNDLKNELWRLTHGYREKVLKNRCYRFAPVDPTSNTHRYNPFAQISSNPKLRVRDIYLIAEILIPSSRYGEAFWHQASRDVFILLAFYLLETKGVATLAQIYDLAKQKDFIGWLSELVEDETLEGGLSHLVKQNAAALLNADAKTRSNILMDFHARMQLYGDPLVRDATSGNDFDLRKLRQEKISLYLNIPHADSERLSPLLTLLWAQMIQLLSMEEPDLTKEPYPVLALLDEFGNMGRIPQLRNAISFVRSYRIRYLIIVQYLAQIRAVYGVDETQAFLNTKAKIAFTLNDHKEDAQFFSKGLGQTTVRVTSESAQSNQRAWLNQHSVSTRYQSRDLLTADEITKLPENEAVMLLEKHYPVRFKKIRFNLKNYPHANRENL